MLMDILAPQSRNISVTRTFPVFTTVRATRSSKWPNLQAQERSSLLRSCRPRLIWQPGHSIPHQRVPLSAILVPRVLSYKNVLPTQGICRRLRIEFGRIPLPMYCLPTPDTSRAWLIANIYCRHGLGLVAPRIWSNRDRRLGRAS